MGATRKSSDYWATLEEAWTMAGRNRSTEIHPDFLDIINSKSADNISPKRLFILIACIQSSSQLLVETINDYRKRCIKCPYMSPCPEVLQFLAVYTWKAFYNALMADLRRTIIWLGKYKCMCIYNDTYTLNSCGGSAYCCALTAVDERPENPVCEKYRKRKRKRQRKREREREAVWASEEIPTHNFSEDF